MYVSTSILSELSWYLPLCPAVSRSISSSISAVSKPVFASGSMTQFAPVDKVPRGGYRIKMKRENKR